MNNKIKKQRIAALEDAKTLEEIIIASWGLSRNLESYHKQVEILTLIDKKKKMFYHQELEKKRNTVYTELCVNFINNEDDDNIISRVCQKTNLKWWEIRKLILQKKEPDKIDRALINYILKKYPRSGKKEEDDFHRIREAKIKVSMAEQSSCDTFSEFSKLHNNVSKSEIEQAYFIIKENDRDFYSTLKFPLFKRKKHSEKNKDDKSKTVFAKNDIIGKKLTESYLSSLETTELADYCKLNNLFIPLIRKHVGKLKDKKDEFFNLDYEEQLTRLLTYKTIELWKAQPVIDDMIAIKNGSKELIDYYYFYKSGFFTNYFGALLRSASLHNMSHMFKDYVDNHESAFRCFDDREIGYYSKNGKMCFEDELITYKPGEFLDVVSKLREENLPLARGLIVQKINEVKKEKMLTKQL